jgi:oleandomycin transport system ATP-binding protein
VHGHDVVAEAAEARRQIALTGQYAAVDEDLTGTENLVLIARLLRLPRARAGRVAAELLERFGLAAAAGRSVRTYSGSMRRRLDLAASLIGEPRALYLDEPTTGLDQRSRGEVWELLRGLVAGGVTVPAIGCLAAGSSRWPAFMAAANARWPPARSPSTELCSAR